MEKHPNCSDEKDLRYPEDERDNEEYEFYSDEEWKEDEEEDGTPPPSQRKWVRNTILSLVVAALIGNVLAFWPQIYNMKTLPFLSKSKELSSREEIQSYKRAVVLVSTDKGKGTGFHVSGGYIVTNYHVIENNGYILVKFPENDQGYVAKVASGDPELDIALLKVDAGSQELPFIEVERERTWEPGEHVYVIGNPLYFSQIVSEGTLLGTMPVQGRSTPVIALDAPIFKGNSGSPVINEDGKAIAVIFATTEITHDSKTVEAGLAVPLDALESLPGWLAAGE
ncbi:S1C family serine protease [Cohnella terricola]|uniref:Trypsin-like peptidase domain-containing protein n=1 Tax=Cohnella terricola TaxID=1289167 RepID=A0A559JGM5_9BACL|nr:serine protease [Cohnella terricola]TVX99027.1 trypsin-like peptidase domain-containing protein [Cohnella terricola]